jgi:hypothetical protein
MEVLPDWQCFRVKTGVCVKRHIYTENHFDKLALDEKPLNFSQAMHLSGLFPPPIAVVIL